jgi:hypothetical protein
VDLGMNLLLGGFIRAIFDGSRGFSLMLSPWMRKVEEEQVDCTLYLSNKGSVKVGDRFALSAEVVSCFWCNTL